LPLPDLVPHWPAQLGALGGAIAFVLAAATAGHGFLGWIGLPALARRPERRPVMLLAGVALHATVALGLGLCGLLVRSVAVVVAVGLAAAALPRLRALFTAKPAMGAPGPFAIPAVAAFAALGLLGTAPQWWVDTLAYHLAGPATFNTLHKWVSLPHYQFWYRMLAEGWLGQGLLLGGEPVAALLNTLSLGLLAWLVHAWAAELAGPEGGWLAAAALAASTQAGFLAVHIKVDLLGAAFALAALHAWCHAWSTGSRRQAFLAGCAIGWALCTKYIDAVPVAGMAAYAILKAGSRGRMAVVHLGLLAAGAGLAGFPHLAAGWGWTGNPVFPFVVGGLGWSADQAAVLQAYGAPGFDWDLARPLTMARAAARFLVEDAPLAVLAVPLVARIPRAARPAAVAWVVGLVPLAIAARSVRFLFPVVPFLAVVSAASVGSWLAGRRDPRARRAARAGVAAGLAVCAAVAVHRADLGKGSWPVVLGRESREAYRSRVLTTWHAVTREVSGRLAPMDRLIVVGDGRGYGFTPVALTRDLVDMPVMLGIVRASPDAAGIARHVRQTGARYLLLNDITAEFNARGLLPVFRWSPGEVARYRAYWERYAVPLTLRAPRDGDNGGFTLYRLRRSPGPVAPALAYLPGTEQLGAAAGDEDPAAFAARVIAAARLVPRVAWLAARAAPELIRAGRYAEAVAILRPCLAAPFPQGDVLHGQLGQALAGLGRLPEARAEFAAAARLNPAQDAYRLLRDRAGGR
jgi:hypothetical protein